MCTINKLGIRGIRSFSPNVLETIKFDKPLTLIVGHNGAGKTTIVECLKMATTGEVPPSANKGQNFLHDPRLLGLNEVKGQIRLIFTNVVQAEVAVIRSFQLTNTRDRKGGIKASFKALDALVQLKDANGNLKSTSNKCVDTNATIASLMGVPKPVLENGNSGKKRMTPNPTVIFCHQEDGAWPLSDTGTLKKKFDELFGSSRFTKALDLIAGLRKYYTKLAKEKQQQLDLLSKDVTALKSLQDKSDACMKKEADLDGLISTLNAEQIEAKQIHENAQKALNSIAHTEAEWDLLQRQIDEHSSELKTLQNSLQEMYDESYEQLKTIQQHFAEQAVEDQSKVQLARQALAEAESSSRSLMSHRDELLLKSEHFVRAQQKLASAQERLNGVCSKADLIIASDTTGTLAPVVKGKLASAGSVEERLRLVRAMQGVTKTMEKRATDQLNSKLTALMSKAKVEEAELANQEANRNELARTLAASRAMADSRQREERERTTLAAAIETTEREIAKYEDLPERLKRAEALSDKLNSERQSLEEQMDTVQHKLVKLERVRAEGEKLQAMRVRLADLSTRAESLKTAHLTTELIRSDAYTTMAATCGEFVADNWARETARNLAKARQSLNRNLAAVHRSTQELGQAQNRFDVLQTRIRGTEREVETLTSRLRQETGVESPNLFLSKINTLREETDIALKESMVARNAEEMYSNYFDYSIQKRKCAFCTRAFKDQKEVENFKRHLNQRIQKLPAQISATADAYAEKQKEMEHLERFKDEMARLSHLKDIEMPSLRAEIEEAELALNAAREALDEAGDAHKQAEEEVVNYQKLDRLISDLEAINLEAAPLECEVTELEREIKSTLSPSRNAGGKRSRAEFEGLSLDELPLLKTQEQDFRTRLQRITQEHRGLLQQIEGDRNQRRELSVQESLLKDRRQRLTALTDNLRAASACLSPQSIRESEKELSLVEQSINQLRTTIQAVQTDIETTRTEMVAVMRRIAQDTSNIASMSQEVLEAQHQIDRAQIELESYESTARELEDAKRNLNVAQSGVVDARRALEKAEGEIKDRVEMEHNLQENLKVHELSHKINELKGRQESLRTTAAATDILELKQAAATGQERLSQIERAMANKEGERTANREWIKQLGQEMNHSRFKGIERAQIDAEVECITLDLAAKDLKRYHGALDRALMIYHTEKMKEINLTIRELWQQIYRGNDIECIAIRSSTEAMDAAAEAALGGSGSRSYNYRVVMMKDGVELDMKGRCSAGQKVLACLVIRLALAESFAVQCGVMTLDEPTTNLDRKNVESLARALSDLIEARRQNSNFQLILITHDEEFVSYLQRFDASDRFYQVRKDEHGHSTIRALQF